MRRLTREEILTYVNVLAAAGNETTNRLIGWTGKVLGRPSRPATGTGRGPLAHPERHRGDPALRAPGSRSRPLRHPRRRVLRPDRPGWQRSHAAPGGRPTGTNGASPTATCSTSTAPGHPASHVRLGDPLLPGRGAGPARRPHRAGGGADAVPRLGGRHRQRREVELERRPRLGQPSRHSRPRRAIAPAAQEPRRHGAHDASRSTPLFSVGRTRTAYSELDLARRRFTGLGRNSLNESEEPFSDHHQGSSFGVEPIGPSQR